MNYELAKQLKAAGFPFEECYPETCTYIGPSLDGDNGKNYHYPTLEELIEACGDRFGFECLIKEPVGEISVPPAPIGINPHYGKSPETIYKWKATAYQFKSGTYFEGSTPTEAVAKLWLALNPPKPEL